MQRTWLYRIRPSVLHEPYRPMDNPFPLFISGFDGDEGLTITPNQTRWTPQTMPAEGEEMTFLDGIRTICGAGGPSMKDGLSIHTFAFNKGMGDTAFYSSDGDILLVGEMGEMIIRTEMGRLKVGNKEIAVMPRGMKFSIDCDAPVRGYMVEVYKGQLALPDLGPIGTNGLANP